MGTCNNFLDMTFTILLDATKLTLPSIRITGTVPTCLDSKVIHTVQLAPGIYQFGQATGTAPEASFQVHDDCMADSDSGARTLADCGTNTIWFLLIELVLEYTPLVEVTYWLDIIDWLPAKKRQALHLMPKSFHRCRSQRRLFTAQDDGKSGRTLGFDATARGLTNY